MSAPLRLDVATSCPACGAPLDVVEGATSAHCGHCGNRLLLPGRRRVVTYLVRPRTTAQAGLAVARAVVPSAHDPELCLVPYYRYSAEELRWDWTFAPDEDDGVDPAAPRDAIVAERAIEKTFLACAWDGLGLYSLGARATALRLECLRADGLPAGARVIGAEVSTDDALAHALRMTSPELVAHRAVVCGVLSLVYFPFWFVPLGTATACRFAIVDAVTGRLVTTDGPPALRARLAAASAPVPSPFEPRVLLCPNCGWDLPDDAEHVVFFCTRCERAWALGDARLDPVPHAVVSARPGALDVQHRPLWLVDAPGAPPGLDRIVVPGFRHRVLRLVLTLATLLTRKAPPAPPTEGAPVDAVGAYLDREDARTLARFVAAGIDRRRAATLELAEPRLVWWPFERLAGSLRESYTGFALPAPGQVAPAAVRTGSTA